MKEREIIKQLEERRKELNEIIDNKEIRKIELKDSITRVEKNIQIFRDDVKKQGYNDSNVDFLINLNIALHSHNEQLGVIEWELTKYTIEYNLIEHEQYERNLI